MLDVHDSAFVEGSEDLQLIQDQLAAEDKTGKRSATIKRAREE